MKLQYFFLMSTLISFLSHAQHIVGTHSKISFNGHRKTLYEWLRDDKKKEFGKTAIIFTKTNQPPFIPIGTIKGLTVAQFQFIAKGHSFYCSNIKKQKDICYGAFVINPDHHFDAHVAKKICEQIKNAYLEEHIHNEFIPLELSEASEEIEEKKDQLSKHVKIKKITAC